MNNSKKTNRVSNKLKRALFARLLFFGIFCLMLSASIQCANIQQPTGGPIDSIPPKLLGEIPKNLTTDFSDKLVILSFDEFIRLNNANREISISPEMDELPTFKVKRKNLEMALPDSLAENTTYVINFGQAIVDNNEGNPFKNYSYVFSTGDKIDSLSVSGTVKNAQTNDPEMQISVLLIPLSQDSTFGKRKANIFTTTDSSGNFKLNYLRENTYRIYALREQNNDRIYNSPEEWIGFLPDSIVLEKDTAGISLRTSKPIPKDFLLLDRKIESNGKVLFRYNKPLVKPEITVVFPLGLDSNKLVEHNKNKDSLSLWLGDMTFDSLKVRIYDDALLLDSVTLRRGRNDRYNNKITLADNLDRTKVNKIKNLVLTSVIPIKALDPSKFVLTEDSVKIENFQLIHDASENKKIIIQHNWKQNKRYDFNIEASGLIGYFEETNDKFTRRFTLDESEKYGDLTLKITIPDSISTYIIELTDEKKEQLIQSNPIHESTTLSYKNLREGKYLVRVVYDKNKNGKWDPGDIEKNTQPEWIWYYDKTFIIRPNWEQEEQINIPPNPIGNP